MPTIGVIFLCSEMLIAVKEVFRLTGQDLKPEIVWLQRKATIFPMNSTLDSSGEKILFLVRG